MGDFLQFYSNGGVFMHVITLAAGAAVTALILNRRGRELGQAADDQRLLGLADRLAWLCLALGMLGSLFGCFDFFMALQFVPAEEFTKASLRGLGIIPVTTAWALMVGIPIWAAAGVQRARVPKPSRTGARD